MSIEDSLGEDTEEDLPEEDDIHEVVSHQNHSGINATVYHYDRDPNTVLVGLLSPEYAINPDMTEEPFISELRSFHMSGLKDERSYYIFREYPELCMALFGEFSFGRDQGYLASNKNVRIIDGNEASLPKEIKASLKRANGIIQSQRRELIVYQAVPIAEHKWAKPIVKHYLSLPPV